MTTVSMREAIRAVLEDDGRTVEDYATCEAFLEAYRPGREACLLIDAYLPGMSGLELLQRLGDAGHRLPAIMITGNSDVPMAVAGHEGRRHRTSSKSRSAGDELLASVDRALEQSRDFEQAVGLARETAARPSRGAHAATAPDHGTGPRRPPQQEHRRGPRASASAPSRTIAPRS